MSSNPPEVSATLAGLRPGDRAHVVHVAGADVKLVARLAARGLVPGVELRCLRGGDPMLIGIDESRWALTRHDAEAVHVDVAQRPPRSLLRALLS